MKKDNEPKKQSDFKKRLITFQKSLGLSQGNFEKSVSLSNGAINNIKDGMSSDNLRKIAERYPELNITWLLTGKGDMTIGAFDKTVIEAKEETIAAQKRTITALESEIKILKEQLARTNNDKRKVVVDTPKRKA